MVMLAQPIVDACEANAESGQRRIYLSPRGRTLTQRVVEELAQESELMLLCGHYEGVDERALEMCFPEELSIGDYVLTGGETAALVVIDAISRLLPGVLGSAESAADESFTTGLLEYPQYTRPRDFRGREAPEVLLNGNHAHIARWRREQALKLTYDRRPELLETAPLDAKDRAFLQTLRETPPEDAKKADVGNENVPSRKHARGRSVIAARAAGPQRPMSGRRRPRDPGNVTEG